MNTIIIIAIMVIVISLSLISPTETEPYMLVHVIHVNQRNRCNTCTAQHSRGFTYYKHTIQRRVQWYNNCNTVVQEL